MWVKRKFVKAYMRQPIRAFNLAYLRTALQSALKTSQVDMAAPLAAALAALRRPMTLALLLQIALVGAVLGLEVDVYPWLFQLGGRHHVLLVHAACGVALTLASAAVLGRLLRFPVPSIVEAAWGLVNGCLLVGAGAVLLAAWGRRAEARTHDVFPGIHADKYLNADKMAAAGFLALIAALPSFASVVLLFIC